MIEPDPAPSPARSSPSRAPSDARPADPDKARRFAELVEGEPRSKTSAKRRMLGESRDDASSAPDARPAPAPWHGSGKNEKLEAGADGITRDQQRTPAPAMPVQPESAGQSAATADAAFNAILDRIQLSAQAGGETTVSMSDQHWLAREALIVQSGDGGLTLSLSMNMGDRTSETVEELRRRLEARGLTVDRIDAAGRLDS